MKLCWQVSTYVEGKCIAFDLHCPCDIQTYKAMNNSLVPGVRLQVQCEQTSCYFRGYKCENIEQLSGVPGLIEGEK